MPALQNCQSEYSKLYAYLWYHLPTVRVCIDHLLSMLYKNISSLEMRLMIRVLLFIVWWFREREREKEENLLCIYIFQHATARGRGNNTSDQTLSTAHQRSSLPQQQPGGGATIPQTRPCPQHTSLDPYHSNSLGKGQQLHRPDPLHSTPALRDRHTRFFVSGFFH